MIDLSIVIVSWNVRHLLHRCLRSIANGSGRDLVLQTIVVDNASDDGSPVMVREEFPDVHLVANETNPGFTAANNQGISAADGRYVMLLNPDTEVFSGALTDMVAFADRHPDVGMVGPQLLNPDGTVQPSRRRFPTMRTAFVESTWLQPAIANMRSGRVTGPLTAPLRRVLDRYYVADRSPDLVQDVDWITGAAMLARREAIDEVGGMDEGFFMYSEELDWCRRFHEAGWRIVYLPGAQVVHHGGKSSEQAVAARHIHFQSSKVRYFRKYHGPLKAGVLRWYLLAGYVWQIGVEGVKWLVGHKRPLRAQRIAVYRDVIASRLRSGQQA